MNYFIDKDLRKLVEKEPIPLPKYKHEAQASEHTCLRRVLVLG
jgi:hypothetical protein